MNLEGPELQQEHINHRYTMVKACPHPESAYNIDEITGLCSSLPESGRKLAKAALHVNVILYLMNHDRSVCLDQYEWPAWREEYEWLPPP